MNMYLTFFSLTRKLNIHNGFSFGFSPEKDDVFQIVNDKITPEQIQLLIKKQNPDKVYCSVSFYKHFDMLLDIIDERWIIGGPITNSDFIQNFKNFGFNIVSGPAEYYLGKKELSSDFNFYFSQLVQDFTFKNLVIFNCSLGCGCYWNKCSFCSYSKYSWNKKHIIRPNIDKICEKLLKVITDNKYTRFRIDTCMDCLPPELLDQMLTYGSNIPFISFLRADKKIINVVKKYGNLSNCVFKIGLETLSNFGLKKLNKGTTIQNNLDLVETLLQRGSTVYLFLMDNFPFLTQDLVKESFDTLNKLKEMSDKYSRRIIFVEESSTIWPCNTPKEYDFPIQKKGLEGGYMYVLPENSDEFKYNLQIKEHIINSNMLFQRRDLKVDSFFYVGLNKIKTKLDNWHQKTM